MQTNIARNNPHHFRVPGQSPSYHVGADGVAAIGDRQDLEDLSESPTIILCRHPRTPFCADDHGTGNWLVRVDS